MGAVNLHGGGIDHADPRPQGLEDVQKRIRIADPGQILNAAYPVYHKGGGYNGNGGIFCAADLNFSMQAVPAAYPVSFQLSFPLKSICGCIVSLFRRDQPANTWALWHVLMPAPYFSRRTGRAMATPPEKGSLRHRGFQISIIIACLSGKRKQYRFNGGQRVKRRRFSSARRPSAPPPRSSRPGLLRP